jgi:hypothetical protein
MTLPTLRRALLVIALAPLTTAATARALDTPPVTVGEATDLHTHKALYSEIHCQDDETAVRNVIYLDSENQPLAYKTLSYNSAPATPSYVQRNLYNGETIAVALQSSTLAMTVAGEGDAGKTVTTQIDDTLPLVIDAGFDAFVTDHWDTLVSGQSASFQFPFASRESVVDLRIEASVCSYDTQTDQCFELQLDHWLLKMLVAPIELGYDASLQRLTRYRGLSNIGNGNGEGLVVDISYRYQDLPPQACRDSRINAAHRAATGERPAWPLP